MNNKTLQIWLTLKDEATKRLQGFQGKMIRAANAIRKHWLGIAAAVLTVKKAFDGLMFGARIEQQRQAFDSLTASVGMYADVLLRDLKKASADTISEMELMEKASQAIVLGLDPQKLGRLMEISRASARAFGQDVGFMFESIVTGIGRQSKLILDNLGIIVSASDAYEKYAAALGKSARELTENEKKQAFLNAVLESGENILEKVNIQQKSNYERLQTMKTAFADFWAEVSQGLLVLMQLSVMFWHKFQSAAAGAQQKLGEVFSALMDKMQFAARFWGHLFKNDDLVRQADNMKNLSDRTAEWAVDLGTVAVGQRNLAEEVKELFKVSAELTEQQRSQLAELHKARIDAAREAAQETEKSWVWQEEMAKQSARNIQNAFSEFFFKAFTGELKNLRDVFANFGRSVLQMISNILAKILLIKAITRLAGADGSIFGVPVGSIFHQGGIIKAHQGRLMADERLIVGQTGEGVLSRRGMAALGRSNFHRLNRGDSIGGGQTIQPTIVIKAWDTADIMRNRGEIEALMVDSIRRNGPIRGAIKQYG